MRKFVQWCNGSTPDFGSVSPGSSPGWTTKAFANNCFTKAFFLTYSLMSWTKLTRHFLGQKNRVQRRTVFSSRVSGTGIRLKGILVSELDSISCRGQFWFARKLRWFLGIGLRRSFWSLHPCWPLCRDGISWLACGRLSSPLHRWR